MTSRNPKPFALPASRPFRVRDVADGSCYYFETRGEADRFVDSVCTDDVSGKLLSFWAKRLVVETN